MHVWRFPNSPEFRRLLAENKPPVPRPSITQRLITRKGCRARSAAKTLKLLDRCRHLLEPRLRKLSSLEIHRYVQDGSLKDLAQAARELANWTSLLVDAFDGLDTPDQTGVTVREHLGKYVRSHRSDWRYWRKNGARRNRERAVVRALHRKYRGQVGAEMPPVESFASELVVGDGIEW